MMFSNNWDREIEYFEEENEINAKDCITQKAVSEVLPQRLFQARLVPSFIFKKIGKEIILTDYSIAAINIINNIASNPLRKSPISIFTELPEIISDIFKCFSKKISFSTKILYKQNPSEPARCFRFNYTFVEPDLLFIHVEDVSTQETMLSNLCEREKGFELAISATESGLWDWNVSTGQLIFNDKWATMLGYSPDEVKGHILSWENLLHPEDKFRVLESLRGHFQGQASGYKDEHRLLSKNGDWIWVLDSGKVVAWDNNGRPLRAVGTKIDITDRKQMEKELESRNLELKRQVEEKHRQLIQLDSMLRESERKCRDHSRNLEKMNNTLQVLMNFSEDNKKEIEENITANINERVIPCLEKIESKGCKDQKEYLNIIKSNLDDITSRFSRRLSSAQFKLTPAEIEVANLLKYGKSTKEIAFIMCLSSKTIETHRRNIRKKLGINGKKINLRNYLLSLENVM